MKNLVISTSIAPQNKIQLYREIFGEAPWNEGYICNKCSRLFPLSGGQPGACTNCNGGDILPFYQERELAESFIALATKKQYVERVAQALDGNPIGFAWGWSTDLEDLNNEKLELSKTSLNDLEEKIYQIYPDFNQSEIYYFAEIGVRSEWRGKDVAGQMYRSKMKEVVELGSKYVVVRTTRLSDVPYQWFVKEGFKTVYEYTDERDRVILIKQL